MEELLLILILILVDLKQYPLILEQILPLVLSLLLLLLLIILPLLHLKPIARVPGVKMARTKPATRLAEFGGQFWD